MRTLKLGASMPAVTLAKQLPHAAPDEMRRGSAERDKLYNSRKWRKARLAYLAAHPLCAQCERDGRIVAASIVDHQDGHAHADWRSRFWDAGTWQSLCAGCHNAKSAQELAQWNRRGGMALSLDEGGSGSEDPNRTRLNSACEPSRETKSVLPKSKTRGGARPGAGRKRQPTQVAPASPAEQTPVEYALAVMRDPEADVQRRDVMARALLTYMRAGRPAAPSTTEDDQKWRGIL